MAKIAFLGVGLIGSGMVSGALARGEAVTVWNRTLDKARALEGKGAKVASSPAEAVRDAERVHLALTDDAVVDQVLAQCEGGLDKSAVVIDHSTTSPLGTAARFQWCAERAIEFLHAPVFMGPQMCRESKGIMLCAGPTARYVRVQRSLEKMTGEVWYLGERTDLAAAYKLFGNAMILTITGGLADVFAMAKGLDLPATTAYALFSKFKPAGVIDGRGAKMATGDFAPSFELSMARKDLRLMLETAARSNVPLAVLPGLAQRMDSLIAEGHGGEDLGALARDAVTTR